MKTINHSIKSLLLATTLFSTHLLAQDVTLTVTGVETHQGVINVAVYNSEEGLKQYKAWHTTNKPASADTVSFTLKDVPDGEYGFMVYQDVDNDGKLGRNFMGIPNEPYGFSNNPRLMGPPRFKQLAVAVNPSVENVIVDLR